MKSFACNFLRCNIHLNTHTYIHTHIQLFVLAMLVCMYVWVCCTHRNKQNCNFFLRPCVFTFIGIVRCTCNFSLLAAGIKLQLLLLMSPLLLLLLLFLPLTFDCKVYCLANAPHNCNHQRDNNNNMTPPSCHHSC